jgi:hypothetical protein
LSAYAGSWGTDNPEPASIGKGKVRCCPYQ